MNYNNPPHITSENDIRADLQTYFTSIKGSVIEKILELYRVEQCETQGYRLSDIIQQFDMTCHMLIITDGLVNNQRPIQGIPPVTFTRMSIQTSKYVNVALAVSVSPRIFTSWLGLIVNQAHMRMSSSHPPTPCPQI
ncbi:alpha/beta-hydrolase [Zalerion maritima]|uniref:Alpha/beta-hydrolase n=1 Tax=Zalerion maritima TaxID=339359 RepID=A0AAD5RHM7_9PEZI|nr:alpha/beta-hydrolase [Zalerion maritima]